MLRFCVTCLVTILRVARWLVPSSSQLYSVRTLGFTDTHLVHVTPPLLMYLDGTEDPLIQFLLSAAGLSNSDGAVTTAMRGNEPSSHCTLSMNVIIFLNTMFLIIINDTS